jgi:rhodanese-related sulfurtransferase
VVFTLGVRLISPEELFAKMKREGKVNILDVRAEEKFKEFHIEGSGLETQNIPKTDIFEGRESVAQIPKDAEIVVTCTTGNSATKCANILAEKDYNVLVLEGGITAWKEFIKATDK